MAASPSSLAVIGGGWAGCAAAIRAIDLGLDVTLFEMAPQLGGRARRVDVDGLPLDNGQHILIGAYTECLRLMKQVGVRTTLSLLRAPLQLVYADGSGLRLPPGHPVPALLRGILGYPGWTWRDRWSLLRSAAGWALRSYRCPAHLSVAQLCAGMTPRVRDEFIDPLCVAALNTPSQQASGMVFLRVLHDALFSGAGASDLLLPRTDLSALFPDPAGAWLADTGAQVHTGRRVMHLAPRGAGWEVDGQPFDAVVLACSPVEAARLAEPVSPEWARCTRALPFEPIVTVYARAPSARLPRPMMPLRARADAPAQFVFDHGQLSDRTDLLAFVISGAADWVARGMPATVRAVFAQAESELARYIASPLSVVCTLVDKRATFLCRPGLQRPATHLASGLAAAGDYVDGPYPATLEGAVRSGAAAVDAACASAA